MSSSNEASPGSSTGASTSKGPRGRPKGSHGESLIKRSKEMLGLDRVNGMQRRKRGTKDDNDTKPTTRREQVLEAQRTHRMRTKLYIKELEAEVLRLRKSEAAAKAQVESLERKSKATLELLQAHGLFPPESPAVSDGMSTAGFVSPISGGVANQSLPLHTRQSGAPSTSAGWSPPPAYLDLGQDPVQLLSDGNIAIVNSPFIHQSQMASSAQPASTKTFALDDSETELDFILALERLCMAHLEESHFHPHAAPFDAQAFLTPGAQPVGSTDDEPEAIFSGHVLTASMPLWHRIKEEGHACASSSPDARRAELAHLLNSSYRLGLRGEIAPVQILELVKHRATTNTITVQQLQNLAESLRGHLRCYGFGAVFDQDVVRDLVMKHC